MRDTTLKLIAGLGNPGPQYEHTRHNAGFWLVDLLARKYGDMFRSESRFKGDTCRISIEGQSVWLLKPMNFMNRSGEAIAKLAHFYKLPIESILVAHDELDLPPGIVRLKKGGGHGGHNGLRDSIRHLGRNDFLRVRIGIGHPGSSAEVTNYVLRRAPQQEQTLIEEALTATMHEFPRIVTGDIAKAMNALHSRKPTPA